MELNADYVFQTDSEIVNRQYLTNQNYLIEYDRTVDPEYCVLYFSSNNIYFPNTSEAFTESIIDKGRYEWYGNRINKGFKHIFLRDIKKQWYLTGINNDIDDPEKLIAFLKAETQGYKIIAVGSSAGGFISTIIGQSLGAEQIYSFNGQSEILSLLAKPNASTVNPILFRNKDNSKLLPFFDVLNFITHPKSIFYFYSTASQWDIEQHAHLTNRAINVYAFKTSNHGIPFLKTNLPVILNLPEPDLLKLSGMVFHPILFSLKIVGLAQTVNGVKIALKAVVGKILLKLKR
ncbi:hypothetical protein [Pedobacter duraquae]|uniref:Alpha/beta hydrolase n=1 Tax=Pedobacter duraquae TaxID=425511 RepID=A0A4R6IBV4_9SPHI|nr:hypothetical protein [Pedobacter duraquae]TDO19027.1 hypothetical protein CLV32_4649 [Pedobacter duraquae]